jgi:hypothetical protein
LINVFVRFLFKIIDELPNKKDPSPKTQVSRTKTYFERPLGIWSLIPITIGMRLNEHRNLSRFKHKTIFFSPVRNPPSKKTGNQYQH